MSKQLKISFILIIITLVLGISNNFLFTPILLTLSLITAAAFFISIGYNTIMYVRKNKPEDIWKLGWLGFLGFLGIINSGFFGFLGFFGFFGNRPKK